MKMEQTTCFETLAYKIRLTVCFTYEDGPYNVFRNVGI
jgi:hypothetical protein